MSTSLQCAVIGRGRFGKHYIRLLQDIEGVKLAGVGGRDDSEELLKNSAIDCVVIATPVATHFSLAKKALEAGKHILVEKPLTATYEEAVELEGLARESKRVFLVGHQYIYNDYINFLKAELEKETLGEIHYIFAEHFYFGPVRYGVGCFWETAVHELALIDYLFQPENITEVRGRSHDFMKTGRDDFAGVEMVLPNGALATIVVSWFAPEKIRRMVIAGDKGFAVFDEQKEEKLKFTLVSYPSQKEGETSHFFSQEEVRHWVPAILAREPLRNQLEHFICCIRNSEKPLTGVEHAMRVMKMLNVISKEVGS